VSWLDYLIISLLVHVIGWTLTARSMYRKKRIYEVGKPHCPAKGKDNYHRYDSCGICQSDSRHAPNEVLAQQAALEAVFWPFTIIPRSVISFAKRNPTLAPKEIEIERARREQEAAAERLRQQAHIARLEKELEASKGEISDRTP
jgi:hypothetical protein